MPPCLSLRSCELLQLYRRAFSAPVIIIGAGGSASLVLVAVFFYAAAHIPDIAAALAPSHARYALEWALWVAYWFWQSVAFAGLWTLGACVLPCVIVCAPTQGASRRTRGARAPRGGGEC